MSDVQHHAFDFREPGDVAAANRLKESMGPPAFAVALEETLEFVLVEFGPLTVRLTDVGAKALADSLAVALAKLAELRAEAGK